MTVANRVLSEENFAKQREEVLSAWPTGNDVDLADGIEYQKRNVPEKNVCLRLLRAKNNGEILIQPRAGIAPLEPHIELVKYLEKYGKADILPASVDSYTRFNRYADAGKAIELSIKEGRSLLNGLPVVNYGVKQCRRVTEAVSVPSELRIAAVDVRMVAEVAFAAGFTAFVHGPVCPTMHYSKYYRLEESIKIYQYVFKLMGIYARHGIPIMADIYGLFSNVGVPQSLIFAPQVCEALIAAEQGVKYLGVNVIMQGNLNQDIAGLRVLPRLMREYLDRFGYRDVTVFTVANQWTGPYPPEASEAYALDALNTVAAVFGRANMVMVKSIDQGVALPAKESNAAGLSSTKYMINLLKDQAPFNTPEIQLEEEMLVREAKQILDKILELGDGDPAAGVVAAFESGIMETPFSSNIHYSRGKIMVARDKNGACRYFDCGDLPFSHDVKEFHKQKIKEREEAEGREGGLDMIIDSILGMSKGALVYKS